MVWCVDWGLLVPEGELDAVVLTRAPDAVYDDAPDLLLLLRGHGSGFGVDMDLFLAWY